MTDHFFNFLGFFKLSPEEPRKTTESNFGGLFQFLFISAFTLALGYEMYHFAYAGMAGSLGMGVMLFLSLAVTIIVNLYIPELRIRSFIASNVILVAFFICLVPVNMNNSRPPHDQEMKEVIEATGTLT